jgi:hypothetical protein
MTENKDYKFLVVMIQDSGTVLEKVWTQSYDNAVEAVKSYQSFVDHGICVLERVVTLTEPNGLAHRKIFKYPYGSAEAYEAACVKWRNNQFNPLMAVK